MIEAGIGSPLPEHDEAAGDEQGKQEHEAYGNDVDLQFKDGATAVDHNVSIEALATLQTVGTPFASEVALEAVVVLHVVAVGGAHVAAVLVVAPVAALHARQTHLRCRRCLVQEIPRLAVLASASQVAKHALRVKVGRAFVAAREEE